MSSEPPSKKRFVRVLVEKLGDAIIFGIRLWRLAKNPHRRRALLRLAREVARRRWEPVGKWLDPYWQVFDRRVLHPLAVRFRLLRCRVAHFHRVRSLSQLRRLYVGSLAGAIVVVCLLTYLLTPRFPAANRKSDAAIARLMEDTANLIAAERLTAAEANIAELKTLLPDNPTVLTFAGAVKSLRKDYAGARVEYARAVALNPSSFNAAFNLAEVDFVTQNYTRAETQFQAMLDQRPGDEILLFRLFLCALLQKDRPRADALLAALPSVGATPAWHYANAVNLFAAKKRSEAQKILATARILYPDRTAFFESSLKLLGY